MRHYLIMCKDDQQWLDYVTTMSDNTQHSKQYTLDTRDVSFILHDNFNPDNVAVYFKNTPEHRGDKRHFPRTPTEQIWLCMRIISTKNMSYYLLYVKLLDKIESEMQGMFQR